LIFEVANAVAFLHKKKLLHNALKSSNVLVVRGAIRISDFGMGAAAQIQLTQLANKGNDKTKIGITRWLAPETTAIDPLFSEKSDVFALGMVLYEISEGSIPFSEVTGDAEVLKLIKHEKKRPRLSDECPEVLAKLIPQCWDAEAAKRPHTAEVLRIVDIYSHAHKESIPHSLHSSRSMPFPNLFSRCLP
jgi:serine/threonine protein kinase